MKRISLIVFLIFMVFSSCQNNLTFDNISIEPEPIVTLPFLSFDLTQNNFYDFNSNTEVLMISDTTRYTFFQEGIVRDHLYEMDWFFELRNQFNRDFILQMSFLNDNNQTTHTFDDITIFANSGTLDFFEKVEVGNSPDFLNSTKFVLTMNLIPDASNPIDPNQDELFEFKSRYIGYLSF